MVFKRLQNIILLEVLPLDSKIMKFSFQNEIIQIVKVQNDENKWQGNWKKI